MTADPLFRLHTLQNAHRQIWALKRHVEPSHVPPAAVLHHFAGARESLRRFAHEASKTQAAMAHGNTLAAMKQTIRAGAFLGQTIGAGLMTPADAVIGTSRSYGYGHQLGRGKALPTEAFAAARYGLDVGLLGVVGASGSTIVGLVGGAAGAICGALIGSVVASFHSDRIDRLDTAREHTVQSGMAKGARLGATTSLAIAYPVLLVARGALEALRLVSGLAKLGVGATCALVGATLGALGSLGVGAAVSLKKAMATLQKKAKTTLGFERASAQQPKQTPSQPMQVQAPAPQVTSAVSALTMRTTPLKILFAAPELHLRKFITGMKKEQKPVATLESIQAPGAQAALKPVVLSQPIAVMQADVPTATITPLQMDNPWAVNAKPDRKARTRADRYRYPNDFVFGAWADESTAP